MAGHTRVRELVLDLKSVSARVSVHLVRDARFSISVYSCLMNVSWAPHVVVYPPTLELRFLRV